MEVWKMMFLFKHVIFRSRFHVIFCYNVLATPPTHRFKGFLKSHGLSKDPSLRDWCLSKWLGLRDLFLSGGFQPFEGKRSLLPLLSVSLFVAGFARSCWMFAACRIIQAWHQNAFLLALLNGLTIHMPLIFLGTCVKCRVRTWILTMWSSTAWGSHVSFLAFRNFKIETFMFLADMSEYFL